jgi:outer membrane receptor protein involved in Fe transport
MKTASVPSYRRNALASSLALALALPFAASAVAQDTTDDEDEQATTTSADGTATLDAVTVVGSRIRRSEIEGPAPVTVITREDFDREGFKTVADALQTLTQNTTSSFTGDLAVTGFTPNAQVVNLRNLGPGYTLTLINGRRPAQYPQPYNRDNNVVNIRAIPSSIIERVEILSGGASAIYGSDAVAGVVNIVLRENFDSNLIRASVGTTDGGGGDSFGLEYTGGRSGDRWSATYAFQYGFNEPVFGTQREQFDSLIGGPRVRTGYEANIFPALSLIGIRQSASPNGPVGFESFYNAEACERFGYTTVTTTGRGTYCGAYDTVASRSISNEQEFYSGYGYVRFDISDTLSFFASATYYQQDSIASSGTEFWGTAGDRFNQTPTGAATSVYFDPQVNHLVQLQRIFQPFELGGNEAASTLFDESTYDITAGLMGSLGDRFDWEASIQHSEYDYEADRPRLLAQAVHDYFLGPRLGFVGNFPVNQLNLERWYTPITPEIYRSFATRVINEGNTESTNANFVITGDLWELPAGPVGFAGIAEWGRQATLLESDPRTSQTRPLDNQTIYNLTSSGRTDGERDRYAVGAEFRLPITSNFNVQAAGRYDKYDDITAVDDAITYNLGLEYRPVESLLLRATYATSFRAPDMQLVFAEGAASFSTILDYFSCRSGTGPGSAAGPRQPATCNVANDPTVYQAQTLIAGNPLLKEEEGESLTAGFVWDIIDNMSLTVDYYRIKLTDAAGQLSSTYVLENEANCRLGVDTQGRPFDINSAFCQNIVNLVTRQVAPGTALDGRVDRINSAYINRATSDTSGIDARFRYRYDTDRWGSFRTDLSYSLLLTDKFQEFDDTDEIDFRDDINQPQRSRIRGSVSWDKGDWSTTVFGTRWGSTGSADPSLAAAANGFCGITTNPATSEPNRCWGRRLAPYMLYNLTVGKRFGENVLTQFQIINVFDNQYREDNSNVAYPFFNSFRGADPLGRRFNVSVQYRF